MPQLMCCIFLILLHKCFASINFVKTPYLNKTLQITTSNGIIQGFEEHTVYRKKFFSFTAIPYAKPPINVLRFQGPKIDSNWSGILNATTKIPCCAGIDVPSLKYGQIIPRGQEDCLYLNVFTSNNPNENGAKAHQSAVLVYFYGGAFIGGCAENVKPDLFLENDLIVVVGNFRVSLFGFLSTEDTECAGNWAIKDQIAILKWVQLNIHKFGGDNKRVTIMGESAGAANVHTILLSPATKNLFHRAILMSGTNLGFWSIQLEARQIAFDLGKLLKIYTNSSKILMDKLRSVSSDTLKNAQEDLFFNHITKVFYNGLPLATVIEPVHEEAILTKNPYYILENGLFNKVPVLMGVTNSEFALFGKVIKMLRPLLGVLELSPGIIVRFSQDFKNRTAAALEIFRNFLRTRDIFSIDDQSLMKYLSEEFYVRPALKTSFFLSKYAPVYFYQFTYEGKIGLTHIQELSGEYERNNPFNGAAHTEDLAYLLSTKYLKNNSTKNDMEVVKKLAKIYSNFIKTGNPTPTRDPFLDNATAPKITPGKFPYLHLDQHFSEVPSSSTFQRNFQFWDKLYEKYADKPYKIF